MSAHHIYITYWASIIPCIMRAAAALAVSAAAARSLLVPLGLAVLEANSRAHISNKTQQQPQQQHTRRKWA